MTTPLLRKSHLYLLRNNKKKICMMGFYVGAKHGNYLFVVSREKCIAVSREDVYNNVFDIAWIGTQSMRMVAPENKN